MHTCTFNPNQVQISLTSQFQKFNTAQPNFHWYRYARIVHYISTLHPKTCQYTYALSGIGKSSGSPHRFLRDNNFGRFLFILLMRTCPVVVGSMVIWAVSLSLLVYNPVPSTSGWLTGWARWLLMGFCA